MSAHKKETKLTITGLLLSACFVFFTILSWVLLFRDKRAVAGISYFYPHLSSSLFSSQNFLLHHGLNTIPTFLFGLVACIAIFYYLKSLTLTFSLRKIIIFAVIFQVITLVSYPILSTDIFSYIFSERVATVHHENVWKVKPAVFSEDKFGTIADWKDTTSVYGGVNFGLYYLPSLIGKNDLLTLVVLYKIIPAIFAIGSIYILYLLLKLYKNINVGKNLQLVFWNPLFVLEIFGSGHNDSIMIFFTLLSLYFYKKKLWLFAGIILTLAVQVKLIPIVLFFFCLLLLLQKRYFTAAFTYLAGFVATNALMFSFMQVSVINFLQRVTYNGGVYWQSLPNVIRYFSPVGTYVILFCFLIWIGVFIATMWKREQDPISSYVAVILVYLLFVSAAYWNWYIIWLLPLIPFVSNKKISLTILIFSFTSLFAYPLLWLSLRFDYQSILWPFVTYLFIFVIPLMTFYALSFKEKWIMVNRFAEKAQNWV
jgi:hypothetical protein